MGSRGRVTVLAGTLSRPHRGAGADVSGARGRPLRRGVCLVRRSSPPATSRADDPESALRPPTVIRAAPWPGAVWREAAVTWHYDLTSASYALTVRRADGARGAGRVAGRRSDGAAVHARTVKRPAFAHASRADLLPAWLHAHPAQGARSHPLRARYLPLRPRSCARFSGRSARSPSRTRSRSVWRCTGSCRCPPSRRGTADRGVDRLRRLREPLCVRD